MRLCGVSRSTAALRIRAARMTPRARMRSSAIPSAALRRRAYPAVHAALGALVAHSAGRAALRAPSGMDAVGLLLGSCEDENVGDGLRLWGELLARAPAEFVAVLRGAIGHLQLGATYIPQAPAVRSRLAWILCAISSVEGGASVIGDSRALGTVARLLGKVAARARCHAVLRKRTLAGDALGGSAEETLAELAVAHTLATAVWECASNLAAPHRGGPRPRGAAGAESNAAVHLYMDMLDALIDAAATHSGAVLQRPTLGCIANLAAAHSEITGTLQMRIQIFQRGREYAAGKQHVPMQQ